MAVAPAIPLYETSTQFKHWRFSKQGLQQTRADLNAGAVARVKTKVEEERKSARNDEAGTAPLAELPSELVSYLSVSDELSLVAFYLAKMAPLARLFHFKDSVTSTAMSYLKRFYLNNTCMDYHPKNVMLTCLFLASKTENQLVSIEAFAAKVKGATPSAVLSLEFLVSQSLRFQYKVHHAHLAAYGVFLDMQQVLEDVTVGQLETQWRKANEYALHSRMSDLELLYTPSQIALASWYLADATLLESWLFSKPIPTADHAMAHDKILELVRSIAKMISDTPKNVDVEIVKDVDKRLKICRNPEKDPNSATYKKRKEADEAALEDKRAQKRAKEGEAYGAKDPFDSKPIIQSALPEVDGSTVVLHDSAKIDVQDDQKSGPSALKPIATPPEDSDDKRLE